MTGNKWLVVGLAISLAINFALAGFFIGRASSIGVERSIMDPTLGFSRVLRELPEERVGELRPMIREHFRSMRPSMGGIRRAQRDLHDALTTEPFDRAATSAALEQFREHLSASQAASHASLVALVAELEPSERRLLVESMRRGKHERDQRRPPGQRPPRPGERPR